jgi:hypothetical protein
MRETMRVARSITAERRRQPRRGATGNPMALFFVGATSFQDPIGKPATLGFERKSRSAESSSGG